MALRDLNWRALVIAGIVAGLIQVGAGVAMYLTGVYFSPWSFLVSLFLLLLCIVFGTRWYTVRHSKSEITYGQALVAGIVISVATGVIYAIYNIISISFFYAHFLDDFARASSATAGVGTPETIAAIRENITANKIALGNLIRLSVAGSLLSVLTGFVFKTHHKE